MVFEVGVRAVVPNDKMRQGGFALEGELAANDRLGLVAGQAAGGGAGELGFVRASDDNDVVEEMLGAGLEKQGDFHNESRGVLAAFLGELRPTLADSGVEDGFEADLGGRVVKNQTPDGGTVGVAVGGVGFGEKLGGDALTHGWVGLEEFAGSGVGIE